MINIVIPMAGRGSRFADAGYNLPKPLINVNGKPMIELVIHNLMPKQEHKFIFIIQEEHKNKYKLDKTLKDICKTSEIIMVDGVTEGAACTVLLAERYIDSAESLMIANCDQWVDININDYLSIIEEGNADGLIMTMKADNPKWSYVKYNEKKEVIKVVEKKVVSDEATVGIYNYAHGCDFVKAAKEMIKRNMRVNNEFYVAPVYNLLIEEKRKIAFYNIGEIMNGMYGLGTPEDLENFLLCDKVNKACAF